MNDRTVWIARFLAVLIILVFMFLMTNLYSKLRQMQRYQRPAATQPSP